MSKHQELPSTKGAENFRARVGKRVGERTEKENAEEILTNKGRQPENFRKKTREERERALEKNMEAAENSPEWQKNN